MSNGPLTCEVLLTFDSLTCVMRARDSAGWLSMCYVKLLNRYTRSLRQLQWLVDIMRRTLIVKGELDSRSGANT